MKPNVFRCSLPQTGRYKVLELTTTTVFAAPNIVVTVEDPDGSLRIALTLVPDHIPVVSFEVSDADSAYRYRDATLGMVEMAIGDGTVTMMWSALAADVASLRVATAA